MGLFLDHLCFSKILYSRSLKNQPKFLKNLFSWPHNRTEDYVLRQYNTKRAGKGKVLYWFVETSHPSPISEPMLLYTLWNSSYRIINKAGRYKIFETQNRRSKAAGGEKNLKQFKIGRLYRREASILHCRQLHVMTNETAWGISQEN